MRITTLIVAFVVSLQLDTITSPETPNDCGLNALYLLCRLENRDVSLSQLIQSLPSPKSVGYSMEELADAAKSRGLVLEGRHWDHINKVISRPVIAYLSGSPTGHFVVLCPVGTTGKMVQIIDPPHAPRIVDISRLASGRNWTGRILVRRDNRSYVIAICIALGVVAGVYALRRLALSRSRALTATRLASDDSAIEQTKESGAIDRRQRFK